MSHASEADEERRSPTVAELNRLTLRELQAGMAAEMGLVEPKRLKRWQSAIKAGTFEPRACAADLLETVDLARAAPSFASRGGSLLRDLVMAPLQRGAKGAGRRARTAAKSGVAAIISQIALTGIYVILVLIALLLLRLRGVEIDAWLDRLLFR